MKGTKMKEDQNPLARTMRERIDVIMTAKRTTRAKLVRNGKCTRREFDKNRQIQDKDMTRDTLLWWADLLGVEMDKINPAIP